MPPVLSHRPADAKHEPNQPYPVKAYVRWNVRTPPEASLQPLLKDGPYHHSCIVPSTGLQNSHFPHRHETAPELGLLHRHFVAAAESRPD